MKSTRLNSKLAIVRDELRDDSYLQRSNLMDTHDVVQALTRIKDLRLDYGDHLDLRRREETIARHGLDLFRKESNCSSALDFFEKLIAERGSFELYRMKRQNALRRNPTWSGRS